MTRISWNSPKQVRDLFTLMDAIENLPIADVSCKNDPDLFFMEDVHNGQVSNAIAKEACQRCPVMVQCGQYATEHNEVYGIWGGLTPAERKKIRKAIY